MDAFLPGVQGWEAVYNNPGIWHFRFNGPTPEALVRGRARIYFDYFWNDFAADKTHSIPEAARRAYATAYSGPGRMHAGWAYFVSFQQAAKDFAQLSKTNDDARFGDWRRQIFGRSPRTADEAGGFGRHGCRPEKRRTLGDGRTTEGHDRRADEISVSSGQAPQQR
jgi:hypothetical protein